MIVPHNGRILANIIWLTGHGRVMKKQSNGLAINGWLVIDKPLGWVRPLW